MKWEAEVIVREGGRAFSIPDGMIKQFKEEFIDVKKNNDRDYLLFLRNSIIIIINMIRRDPSLLNDQDVVQDMIKALAMREALKQNRMLHDA